MAVHPLQAAMDHILNFPGEWDQNNWICGTNACLAGRIVLQADAQPYIYDDGPDTDTVTDRGGYVRRVDEFAADLAGLTQAEAQHLFHASVRLDELCQDTARLVQDNAVHCNPYGYMRTHHHRWMDSTGATVVSAHRRTSFVKDGHCITTVDHPTRAGAYDYASDVATARLLDYDTNDAPPEVPA